MGFLSALIGIPFLIYSAARARGATSNTTSTSTSDQKLTVPYDKNKLNLSEPESNTTQYIMYGGIAIAVVIMIIILIRK